MHCIHCGADVPAGASFCPGCGAHAGVQALRAKADHAVRKIGGCGFLVLLIGALYIASQIFGSGSAPKAAPAPFDAKAAAAKAKVCDDALADLAKAGVMKDRPAADTITVDEDLWAQLPAREKRLFAAAVRCSLLGGTDSGDPLKTGTVEGYRSGKTLATAFAAGVTLD